MKQYHAAHHPTMGDMKYQQYDNIVIYILSMCSEWASTYSQYVYLLDKCIYDSANVCAWIFKKNLASFLFDRWATISFDHHSYEYPIIDNPKASFVKYISKYVTLV